MFVTFVTYIEEIPEKNILKKIFQNTVTSVTSVTRGVNQMKNNNSACHVCVTFVTVLGRSWGFPSLTTCGNKSFTLIKTR